MNKFQIARKTVNEIKAGEWSPVMNSFDKSVYMIRKRDKFIWISDSNGGWFCTPWKNGERYDIFGLFWRHWVYHHAMKLVKAKKKEFDREQYEKALNDFLK